jgi:hypothetical protein
MFTRSDLQGAERHLAERALICLTVAAILLAVFVLDADFYPPPIFTPVLIPIAAIIPIAPALAVVVFAITPAHPLHHLTAHPHVLHHFGLCHVAHHTRMVLTHTTTTAHAWPLVSLPPWPDVNVSRLLLLILLCLICLLWRSLWLHGGGLWLARCWSSLGRAALAVLLCKNHR